MRKIYALIGVALLAACTAVENESPVVDVTGGKIAGNSSLSDEMSLSVKLDRAAADAVAAGKMDISEIFGGREVVSFERIFPSDARNEARTRQAGLDRWYLVRFAEGECLDSVAVAAASRASVSKVQFTTKAEKACKDKPIPLTDEDIRNFVPTKAMVTSDFNDPDFYMQWGLANNADQAIAATSVAGADVNIVPAWRITGGDPRVIVAVIDEGVKYTHPDLQANMWVNPNPDPEKNDIHGWNFVDDAPISWDDPKNTGHGTHVAGIVAAVNNNGIGVSSVAGGTGAGDGVKIMSCQIFSGERGGTNYIIARAIKYAADHGACILQCSYGNVGGTMTSDREYIAENTLEYEAIEYFRATKNCEALDGGAAIFAAGNESVAMADYPGGYADYISVTAFSPDFLPSYYTNHGRGCNISAPGGETGGLTGGKRAGILSTVVSEISDNDYGFMQGTSMSCPHVSGIAALGLSYALKLGKKFSVDEFNAMILTSVNDMDRYMVGTKKSVHTMELEDYQYRMGTGAIDAYRLLMQIEGTPCVTVSAGVLSSAPLDQIFGESADNMTFTGVEIDEASRNALKVVGNPRVVGGKLQIRCDKPGSGKVRVSAIAGGKKPSTPSSMGGMEITREFAVISRAVDTEFGRWL